MSRLEPIAVAYGPDQLIRTVRGATKVRQGRLNRVFRTEDAAGFHLWIGGPPLTLRPSSLTFLLVLAHERPAPVRIVRRLAPDPRSSASLAVIAETHQVPLSVLVPHTHAAATAAMPVDVALSLSGLVTSPARWHRDEEAFAAAGPAADADLAGVPLSSQSLVDLRLFGTGDCAIATGIVERAAVVTSDLAGEVTMIMLRTAFDLPMAVWSAPTADLPPPGAVVEAAVCVVGCSPDLT